MVIDILSGGGGGGGGGVGSTVFSTKNYFSSNNIKATLLKCTHLFKH